MKTLPVCIGKLLCLSLTLLILPTLAEAKKKSTHRHFTHNYAFSHRSARLSATFSSHSTRFSALVFSSKAAERKLIAFEAAEIYSDLQLKDSGLNEKALEYALFGYHRLLKKHALQKSTVLSVCDFSQPSSSKRMYVLDLQNRRLLYRTYVAHGMGSGREYANSFSNIPDSYKSSLGFYITRNTYVGSNGLSLRIEGVEKGFNDKASQRSIVIHGANYVSERILHKYGLMGTTFGCPAVPEDMASQIIPVLKNGTCFFIYYPSKRYLSASKMLNG